MPRSTGMAPALAVGPVLPVLPVIDRRFGPWECRDSLSLAGVVRAAEGPPVGDQQVGQKRRRESWFREFGGTLPRSAGAPDEHSDQGVLLIEPRRIRLAVLSATCLLPMLNAQLQWRPVTPAGVPPASPAFVAADDEARGRVVMLAGFNPTGGMRTWVWDGSNWLEHTPTSRPEWRGSHTLSYDSARRRVVLFGGSEFVFRGDTWEWDGVTWTRTATTGPRARDEHATAFDRARQRTVLFGGQNSTLLFADTWEWDGVTWRSRTPTRRPSRRTHHAMAYDEVSSRVILFGGFDNSTGQTHGDTWEWDGSDWTQRAPTTAPPPRSAHRMVYDRARQRVVLFGGIGSLAQRFADTWEWDGANWRARATATAPSPRNHMALAYDSQRRQVMGFGGLDANGALSDTWLLEPVYAASFAPYGAGCPGSVGTAALTAGNGSLPWLGETLTIEVAGLPSGPAHAAALFVGVSKSAFGSFALPLDLGSIGMAGCSLLTSVEVVLPLAKTGGTAQANLAIPLATSLLGGMFFVQTAVLDGAANSLGVVLSNGGEATIGGL